MSRFVSAGTTDAPDKSDGNDEWAKAQALIEKSKGPRTEPGRQEDGKSLYEVLQANNAAKQEAFEEAAKLKNQFRSLNEDEVDFLDSVLESTRTKEATVRKETAEGLSNFRKQQEKLEKTAVDETQPQEGAGQEELQWAAAGRKRRRGKDKEVAGGLKLRKTSSSAADAPSVSPVATGPAAASGPDKAKAPAQEEQPKPPASSLVAYGSDSDD